MKYHGYLADIAIALACIIIYLLCVMFCIARDSCENTRHYNPYSTKIAWIESDTVLPPVQHLSEETKQEIHENIVRLMDADYEYVEPAAVYTQPEYDPYGNTGAGSFKEAGVVYDAAGTRYTWYSENVLPGGGLSELNSNGRSVNEEGIIVDGDGYVAVASSDYPIGTVISTPFGEAKVYDTGCASGTVDVYTTY